MLTPQLGRTTVEQVRAVILESSIACPLLPRVWASAKTLSRFTTVYANLQHNFEPIHASRSGLQHSHAVAAMRGEIRCYTIFQYRPAWLQSGLLTPSCGFTALLPLPEQLAARSCRVSSTEIPIVTCSEQWLLGCRFPIMLHRLCSILEHPWFA